MPEEKVITEQPKDGEKEIVETKVETKVEPTEKEVEKETSDAEFVDDVTTKESEKEAKERNRLGYEQRQKKKEEIDRKVQELADKRLLESVKGDINHFTSEPIETIEDYKEYRRMKKLEKEGKDPIADYHKEVKRERQEEIKQLEANNTEAEAKEKIRAEVMATIDEATKSYGVDVNNLYKTSVEFKAAMDEYREDGVPLKAALKLYFKGKEKIKEQTTKRAEDLEAKSKATPGGLGGDKQESQYFTEKEIDAMSKLQIKENFEKVEASLYYIRNKKK